MNKNTIARFRTIATGIPLLLMSLVLAGCVGSATGQLIPSNVLDENAQFYVERQPKDERNLAVNIAEGLKARGIDVSAGEGAERPEGIAYIVTYVDRWMWDMRMYLADLRIEVRDANDATLVGYGQSSQSSLKAMGKDHDDVVNAALTQLVGK